jgi:hypothetical protein
MEEDKVVEIPSPAPDSLQLAENVHEMNNNPVQIDLSELKPSVLDSFKSLIGEIPFLQSEIHEVIIQDEETFIKNQHQLLSGYYIAIHISDGILRVATDDNTVFLIDMDKVPKKNYALVFRVHKPRKICVDAESIYKMDFDSINSLYDISHVTQMFYGISEHDTEKLVRHYMPEATGDINALLINLHLIKNRINIIIEKNGLFPLVNKEFKLLESLSKCFKLGLPFSKEEYEVYVVDITSRYEKNAMMFEEVYGVSYESKETILNGLMERDNLSIFNEEYLQSIESSSIFGLAVVHRLYNLMQQLDINFADNRIYIKYNLYNEFGNIDSKFTLEKLYLPFLKTESPKHYVTGSYQDLFFRIFANFSNIDYLQEYINEGKLASGLANRVFGDLYMENKALYEFYALSFLKGFIQGYFDSEDMKDFFVEELDFIMDINDVRDSIDLFIYSCKEVLDYISEFDRLHSKDKRYGLEDNMPIYNFVKLTESDIIKCAIALIAGYIDDFNTRNKYRVDIVGVIGGTIILESDEGAFNIALDITNRSLTKAFNKYLTNVKSLCNVSASYKQIKG